MTEEITMCPHGRISTGYCEPCEEEKLLCDDGGAISTKRSTKKACEVCTNTTVYVDSLNGDEGMDCYSCLRRKIEMRDRMIVSLEETKARQKVALNERDTEIRRMVMAFSTISGIAEGMLDQEKRLGPGMCNLQKAQEDGRRMPDAPEEMDDGEWRKGVGL